MRYFFILKLQIEKFPKYYVELFKEYEIHVHPNKDDIIHVDGFACKIEKIDYDISDDMCFISLLAYDNIPVCDKEKEVIPILESERIELEEYDWKMIDLDYGENFDEKRPIRAPNNKKMECSMEHVKLIFAKVKITKSYEDTDNNE